MPNSPRFRAFARNRPARSNQPIVFSSPRAVPTTLLDIVDRIALIDAAGPRGDAAWKGHLQMLNLCRVPGFIDVVPTTSLAGPHAWASFEASTVFMTHYTVLKQALDFRWNSVLIWDVRADFASSFAPLQSAILQAVSKSGWDLFLLGFEAAVQTARPAESNLLSRVKGPVRGVKAYAVSQTLLPHLVKSMEQVLDNPIRLVSPFSPTAAAVEPDAVSLVLSNVLRTRPDFRTFTPAAFGSSGAEEGTVGPIRANVIEITQPRLFGQ